MLFDLLTALVVSALGAAIWFARERERRRPRLPVTAGLPRHAHPPVDDSFEPRGAGGAGATPTARGATCWICGRPKAETSTSGCH